MIPDLIGTIPTYTLHVNFWSITKVWLGGSNPGTKAKERRNAKHKKKDFRRRGNNFPQATTSYNVVRSKEQISICPLNHGSAKMGVFLASSRKLPEGCSQRADFAAFGRN